MTATMAPINIIPATESAVHFDIAGLPAMAVWHYNFAVAYIAVPTTEEEARTIDPRGVMTLLPGLFAACMQRSNRANYFDPHVIMRGDDGRLFVLLAVWKELYPARHADWGHAAGVVSQVELDDCIACASAQTLGQTTAGPHWLYLFIEKSGSPTTTGTVCLDSSITSRGL